MLPHELQPWLGGLDAAVRSEARQVPEEDSPPISMPNAPIMVLPWLWIAPFGCVLGKGEQLKRDFGITHVLSTNVMPPETLQSLYYQDMLGNDIEHCYVPALDILGYRFGVLNGGVSQGQFFFLLFFSGGGCRQMALDWRAWSS